MKKKITILSQVNFEKIRIKILHLPKLAYAYGLAQF